MVKGQNPINTNSVMGLNECIKLKHISSNKILKISGSHMLPVTCICGWERIVSLPVHKVTSDLCWHNWSIFGQSVNTFYSNTVCFFFKLECLWIQSFYDIQGVSNIKTSEADHIFEPIEHTPKSATVLPEML